MKIFFLLSVLCIASAVAAPKNGKNVSDSFMKILEELREKMRNGDEETGFPVVDPLNLDSFSFSFNADDMLSADISATGIDLTGLSDFIANTVRISIIPMGLHFDFTLPYTTLKTETYKLNGMLFGALPIYGEGKAHFEVDTFNFNGNAGIRVNSEGVTLRNLKLNLSLNKLKSETTGMLGGGDIDNVINAIIGDMAADFFNTYSDLIGERIEAIILPIANEFLEGWTLQDLLDLINGSNNNSIRLIDLKRQ